MKIKAKKIQHRDVSIDFSLSINFLNCSSFIFVNHVVLSVFIFVFGNNSHSCSFHVNLVSSTASVNDLQNTWPEIMDSLSALNTNRNVQKQYGKSELDLGVSIRPASAIFACL